METLIIVLRWIHIAAGFTSLIVAPVALATAKGGPAHRRWGKVYFWGMAVVAFTAVFIGLYRPILFLALLAVFSFYSAFRGYRVLFLKRPERGQVAQSGDWIAAALLGLISIGMIYFGYTKPNAVWQEIGRVAMIFGTIGVIFATRDITEFVRPSSDKNNWWYSHMSGMLTSYIAAVSAFSVVNLKMLPTNVRWLWPTAIGVPVIILWVGYYRAKFSVNKRTVRVSGD
jgi:uncharacterized membrane protein